MCEAASTSRRTLTGWRTARLVAVRAPRLKPHTSTGHVVTDIDLTGPQVTLFRLGVNPADDLASHEDARGRTRCTIPGPEPATPFIVTPLNQSSDVPVLRRPGRDDTVGHRFERECVGFHQGTDCTIRSGPARG